MKQLFVTGFPGFIAGRLLAEIAPRAERIHLLVEGRFQERAEAQVRDVAAAAGVDEERFELVVGDITQPGLGMDEATAERLRATCDEVHHLAAVYDLAVPEPIARAVNVEGTAHVNAFVRSLNNLARYNYVSTFAVGGRRSGVIREDDLSDEAGFHNHYESTKYEAEVLVRELLDDGLPVSIYRPAVVVGDSRTGETAKFDGPYMFLRVLGNLPWPVSRLNFGVPDVRFQVVPVDFIVGAIAALSQDPRAAGMAFHLTDPDPATVEEIAELFCQALTRHGTYFRVPSLATKLVTGSGLLGPLGLQREAAPYFFHKATYDCVHTLDLLDGTGVAVPRFADYADRLVEFYLEHEGRDPQV